MSDHRSGEAERSAISLHPCIIHFIGNKILYDTCPREGRESLRVAEYDPSEPVVHHMPFLESGDRRVDNVVKIQKGILIVRIDQTAEHGFKVIPVTAGLDLLVKDCPHLPGNIVKAQIGVDQNIFDFLVQLIIVLIGIDGRVLY